MNCREEEISACGCHGNGAWYMLELVEVCKSTFADLLDMSFLFIFWKCFVTHQAR